MPSSDTSSGSSKEQGGISQNTRNTVDLVHSHMNSTVIIRSSCSLCCKDSRHSALIKMLTDHPHQGLARHDCVASTCLVLPKTLPQAETAPTYSEETEAQAGQVDHPHQGTELESARTHGSPNPSCLPTPPLARGSASLDPPAAYMGSGLCCFDTPRSPPPQQPSSDTLVSVWAFCEGKF